MNRFSVAVLAACALTAWLLASCAPTPTRVGRERVQPEMILIAGGEYRIGSDDGEENEAPVHRVRVGEFYIDKYEVTNSQYQEFINETGHPAPPSWRPDGMVWPEHADLPVTWVSWQDARAFAEWRGVRLPTEIEWEVAARCTSARTYPWGDSLMVDFALPANVAGETDTFRLGPAPVDAFTNGVSCSGAYNMAGNVWEWAHDWYLPAAYRDRPVSGPAVTVEDSLFNQRVIRGGSWFDPPEYARSSVRMGFEPSYKSDIIGFRCARDAD